MAQPTNPLITNFPNGLSGYNGTTYLGGTYAVTLNTAVTTSLLAGSPVGFDGTLDTVFIVNGDATRGTTIYSKNGANFLTIIKNGTAAAMTGSVLGNVTFSKADVLNVQNVGTDVVEVIVHFH
jgi:hypothetical protein